MEERVAEGWERRRFEVQAPNARTVTRGILSPWAKAEGRRLG